MTTLEDVLEQLNKTLKERPYDEINKQQTWQLLLSLFPDDVVKIYKDHPDISLKSKIIDEAFKTIDYLTANLEDINYALAFHLLNKLKPLGTNSIEISERINQKIQSIENQDNKPLLVKHTWIIGLVIFLIIILILIFTT